MYAVQGATPEDTLVLVRATGFLNCVDTEGPSGPSEIYLGCATGAFRLTEISWQDWGKQVATGNGIAVINDCNPSCAEGKNHRVPVVVKLSDLQQCGYGVQVYTNWRPLSPRVRRDLRQKLCMSPSPAPWIKCITDGRG